MQVMSKGIDGDTKIISGESGAVTVGVLHLICSNGNYGDVKELLNLDDSSVVLCFSTEGDTDPDIYREIVSKDFVELD